jgi:hypothetical protein
MKLIAKYIGINTTKQKSLFFVWKREDKQNNKSMLSALLHVSVTGARDRTTG